MHEHLRIRAHRFSDLGGRIEVYVEHAVDAVVVGRACQRGRGRTRRRTLETGCGIPSTADAATHCRQTEIGRLKGDRATIQPVGRPAAGQSAERTDRFGDPVIHHALEIMRRHRAQDEGAVHHVEDIVETQAIGDVEIDAFVAHLGEVEGARAEEQFADPVGIGAVGRTEPSDALVAAVEDVLREILPDGPFHGDVEIVDRGGQAGNEARRQHHARRIGVGLFRLEIEIARRGLAEGNGGRRIDEGIGQRVRPRCARLEQFVQIGRPDVARIGSAQHDVVDRLPGRAKFVGRDVARRGIVRRTHRAVEDEPEAKRNDGFKVSFLDVVFPEGREVVSDLEAGLEVGGDEAGDLFLAIFGADGEAHVTGPEREGRERQVRTHDRLLQFLVAIGVAEDVVDRRRIGDARAQDVERDAAIGRIRQCRTAHDGACRYADRIARRGEHGVDGIVVIGVDDDVAQLFVRIGFAILDIGIPDRGFARDFEFAFDAA